MLEKAPLSSVTDHPSIRQFIELDLATDNQRNRTRRRVLELLAGSREPLTVKKIAVDLEASAGVARNALKYLLNFTGLYSHQVGFKVLENPMSDARVLGYQVDVAKASCKPRERGITQLPRGDLSYKPTERELRLVEQIAGCPVRVGVPSDYESLLHNSGLIDLEGLELEFIMSLLPFCERGESVLTAHLKNLLDVPSYNERLNGNLRVSTELQAIELGFVLSSFRGGYVGIFFLDEKERMDKLLEGDLESSSFDKVSPFSGRKALYRFGKIERPILTDLEEKAFKLLIKAQTSGVLLNSSEIKERTGLTAFKLHNLRVKLRKHRHENGIYFRTRGSSRGKVKQECILVEGSIDDGLSFLS